MVRIPLRWRGRSSKNKKDLPVCSKTLKVSNDLGIHARSAALLAKTANQYRSEITVQKGENKINGKSIIGILTLAAAKGSRIKITAEGVDAEEAVRGLKELVKSKFGEE